MTIEDLLKVVVSKNSSDLHLVVGAPPLIRVDGRLMPIPDAPVLDEETNKALVFSLVNEEQKDLLLVNKELDFSYSFKNFGRFRVNAYFQKATLSAALRLIPLKIPSIEELHLPKICHEFTKLKQGFILVTGPTGHGKSSTLAAIINEINMNRSEHIVTIEDPIEYTYTPQKSIVSQRELHQDTHSWEVALRSVLREDPNVVLIGEMRDYETISAALTIAETGHLVFATLHTNSASQTIDRIIDVFPEHQQPQIRLQLAATLEAVFSQRLLPAIETGRYPAAEILLNNGAVRNLIRESKTHQIDNVIQTSADVGMMTLEMSLSTLVKEGKITTEVAQEFSLRPRQLMRYLKGE